MNSSRLSLSLFVILAGSMLGSGCKSADMSASMSPGSAGEYERQAMEEAFDLEIPDEDAERIQTIGDAMAYVKERKQG